MYIRCTDVVISVLALVVDNITPSSVSFIVATANAFQGRVPPISRGLIRPSALSSIKSLAYRTLPLTIWYL